VPKSGPPHKKVRWFVLYKTIVILYDLSYRASSAEPSLTHITSLTFRPRRRRLLKTTRLLKNLKNHLPSLSTLRVKPFSFSVPIGLRPLATKI